MLDRPSQNPASLTATGSNSGEGLAGGGLSTSCGQIYPRFELITPSEMYHLGQIGRARQIGVLRSFEQSASRERRRRPCSGKAGSL